MALKFQGESTVESHSVAINIGILFIRAAMVCSIVYFELALHLGKAWNSVWQEEHQWGLLDQFHNLSMPLPNALAVAIILGAFLAALGVFLGFLCRINSVILLLILTFLLVLKVTTSPNFTSEAIVLYLIILITLVITGPGRFSMDHILTTQRIRRKG